MLADHINHITECGGSGTVLRGFFRQVDKQLANDSL
jgi:hypothetical protein